MSSRFHPLHQQVAREQKDLYRGRFDLWEEHEMDNVTNRFKAGRRSGIVEAETLLALGIWGFYCHRFLHRITHCDDKVENIPTVLQKAQDNSVDILPIPSSLPFFQSAQLLVCRGGSSTIMQEPILQFRAMEKSFVKAVMDVARPVSSDRHQKDTIVIEFGWGQHQEKPKNKILCRTLNGVKLPCFNVDGFKFLSQFSKSTKVYESFEILLHQLQEIVMKYCPGAMEHTNKARTEFISNEWRRLGFFLKYKIFWEFITFIIKPIDGPYNPLLNHTDPLNDQRFGFDHCGSFWFLYDDANNGTRYRVTIIMTFRSAWGSAMENLVEKGYFP
jgi:hypothetical protein